MRKDPTLRGSSIGCSVVAERRKTLGFSPMPTILTMASPQSYPSDKGPCCIEQRASYDECLDLLDASKQVKGKGSDSPHKNCTDLDIGGRLRHTSTHILGSVI